MAERRCCARRAEFWLGTLVDIAGEAESKPELAAGLTAAFGAIARIHRTLSGHDPQSELSCLNRRAALATQAISADLRAVLECALQVAAGSGGAFDPTVGACVAAAGFLSPQPPADPRASWRDVRLTGRKVRFLTPLVIDLGGIAKGYAVDCAIGELRKHGVAAGRVSAGGDMRVFGGRSEPIHVRTGGPQGIVLPLVDLADGALATSAYSGQRRYIRGRWATPLVDPRAGLPVMSTRTVSVVAPTCMVADALTKVVALRGSGAAPVLAAYGASAMLLSPAAGRWRCTELPCRTAVASRARPGVVPVAAG